MKPNTIYSKSGKGVQEASGKTSLLKRGDRAVLSAIDGRATLAEVAQKVGKSFDPAFQQLISQLDKDGFVREVAAGASASSASQPRSAVAAVKAAPAKAAAAKPASPPPAAAASGGGADDLDFTAIMPAVKRGAAQPAAAPAPRPAPKPAPALDAVAQQRAKEQEAALYKARQEAEARAQAERDRLRQETEAKARAEAEAKIRAETEKKIREEAEARIKAEAEAKARAAHEAAARMAAEAKAKAEAEAQAKIEAERKAREEIERRAREEADKARREAEELRQRLEEERKAREAEEKKRREEEERRRQEEEARRAREEEERLRREEEERRRRLEEEERRMRAEIEAKAREAAEAARREEEERRLREKEAQARQAREMEEARARQARDMEEARSRARERERKSQEETKQRPTILPELELPELRPEPAKASGGSLDALMADLDSFSQREEEERQVREAAESRSREEKKRRVQEEAERRAREQAAHQERERQRAAEEARRRAEEELRAQEEAERRLREAEEQRRQEAEERKRKAQEAAAAPRARASAPPAEDDIGVSEKDLGMDDVRRDEAAVARETRKQQREREREARQRSREARERAQAATREEPVKYPKARRPIKWGRPVAIFSFVVLVGAIAALHIVPLPMAHYEDSASEALGRPVKIGSGRLSLLTGVRLDLRDVNIGGGEVKIATVHAYPRIGSLIEEKKAFRRIELDGVTVPQEAIGATIGARLRGDNFNVGRILVSNLRLHGPVPLPAFEADAVIGTDGAVRSVTLRGPDSLNAKIAPTASGDIEFDVTAATVSVPFVPELALSSFAMKGMANRNGMSIASWGGAALGGAMSGTASVRWSGSWQVEGVVTARSINAAVFAPALLSEGKAEGTGRFSMSGADPAKLFQGARLEGSFTMGKGILGSFDLSRVLHTNGRQHGGRTQFTELSGHGSYDRGAVALRNVSMSAGALHAGASADITPSGALAGRIVADIRTTVQPLRAILVLGGTVKEPQVRN